MLSLQARRAAVSIGGGALLVAWLAAANSATHTVAPVPPLSPSHASDAVALDIREQGVRLRDELTQAPRPAADSRNPFSFALTPSSRTAAARPAHEAPPVPTEPLPPAPLALTLMGIADQPAADGAHRTAILGGSGDEIYMVTAGQTIAGRYSVTTIGVDAVELKDLSTGGYRRLALK